MLDQLNTNKPKYPVYIISKGRYEKCLTAMFFIEDGVDFRIVVEPQETEEYAKRYGAERVLTLPFANLKKGSMPARNWCWQHAIDNGHERHWIFDDNIRNISRFNNSKRIRCNANVAMKAIEDFTDRYTNIAVAGMNYDTFVRAGVKKPFVTNVHVYSSLLIQNNIPYRWRMRYNEDTDLCLQILTNNQCTVLFNAFLIGKVRTMTMKGGNSDELYKDNGRLVMARALEEMWPMFVKTKWRFGRPQHVVNWGVFKTPLQRRSDIDWDQITGVNNYGMKLKAVKPVKSARLQKMLDNDKGV